MAMRNFIGIHFSGFGDLNIAVSPVCSCDCENHAVTNSMKCKGGTLICAMCDCLPGRFGDRCDCTEDIAEDPIKCDPANSTDDSFASVCNNQGECICGRCSCREHFSGDQCECYEQACPKYNGETCGGIEKGKCTCHTRTLIPKCYCNLGFSGSDCSCSTSQDACRTPKLDNEEQLCSDKGVCVCNQCQCYRGFSGPLCTTCATGNACLQERGPCFRYKDCAECLGFGTGYNLDNCSNDCGKLLVDIPREGYKIDSCESKHASDRVFSYTVVRNQDNSLLGVYVDADKNTGSHKLFSNLPFLLGLIFGLAALVFIPLSIWKLVTLYG
ncbi:integrin beta-1-like [Corticium candelabrum]|uniref:integrin beta-1-like n=1 Tax=Corticium candelabrum TaxID=121492 RepID=UPI002E268030|nr:integrin beta-1-like [Corticium candelabrum]